MADRTVGEITQLRRLKAQGVDRSAVVALPRNLVALHFPETLSLSREERAEFLAKQLPRVLDRIERRKAQ